MKTKKISIVFLALLLTMFMGSMSLCAADSEPAEVQDTYDIDGVTYVNTGDKTFSKNQTAYYKAMLGNKLTNNKVDENMRKYSISDLWMQTAWYMTYYNNNSDHANDLFKRWNRLYEPRKYSEHPDYWEPRQQAIMNLLLAPDTGEIAYDTFPFKWGDDEFNALWFRDTLRSAADSKAMAEDVARTAATMEEKWGKNVSRIDTVEVKNAPDESGLVFYRTLGTVNTDEDYYKDYDLWSDDYGHATHMVVAAFSDFTVTPIIPAENDSEPNVFVKSKTGNTDSSVNRPMVSDVKNASTLPATVSQSISETTSQTLTSNISGSSSHAVAQTHKTGIKFQPRFGASSDSFGLGIEIMYEYSNTVTDTVTKGWSKSESVTNSNSKTNSVSVTLPPYTAVLLNQKRSSGETIYTYNCPVALNFKATVYYVSEDVRGGNYSCVHFRKIAEFGGEETAMVDLQDRYEKYKSAATADQDFIRWNDMSEHCDNAINLASTTATFDSTDATFSNLTEVVKTEVDSILPILPIKYIRPVIVNNDSTLTNQQWDFDIDMDEGDSDYLSRIKLKAINDAGVEFATFNQAKGHIIVVDENGNEDTSGSIIEIVKVNGQNKYVAKGEGIAYLKYIINEDEYQTAEMAAAVPSDRYITNEDIEESGGSTAVIEVKVHHKHKLTRHAAKAPTCTEDGNTVYWVCSEDSCGKLFSDKEGHNEITEDQIVTPKTGHSWNKGVMTKAPSTTKEGTMKYTCMNCGEVKTESIAKLKAANIFAKISSNQTSQRISWTKVKGASGYNIYFTPCTNNETVGNYDLVKTVNSKTFSFTKKSLKKGEIYKSYVEAFKKINGKKVVIAKSLPGHSITGNYNNKYTNPKKVTTGKAKIAVKKGKKYKIKGNKIKYYNKKRKALKHEAAYRYKSTNTKVATVSSKGVIKGKSKGSCKVHVIANNGVEAVIKVTVK